MKTIRNIIRGMPLRIALLSLLFSFAATAGTGAETEKRFTLSEAIKAALENNHALKAHQSALSAKREDVGIARSFLLPKISIEERYLQTVNPGYAFMTKLNQQRIAGADFLPDSLNHPSAVNDFQTAISFEQPLFTRKASLGLEMSKRETEAAGEDLQRKKEETAFKVMHTYLMVGTAAEYVKAAEKALEDAREHQRLAEARYKTGLGLYSDTLRSATAIAEAEQRVVSARKKQSVAKRALGLVTGSSDSVDVAEVPPALPLRDMDYFQTQALARRDLKSLALRKENAQKNVNLAEAGFFPFLGVGGTYQLNDHRAPLGNEGDSWQLMAFLRWEAFDGTKGSHEKTKAQYQVKEAEENLAGMKKMILFQVYEAYLTILETKKNMELAQAAAKTAEEGRRLVRVRYEGSLSPLVDLLDAQVSFDHALANLVARENDYKIAIANLSYESGTILQDLALE